MPKLDRARLITKRMERPYPLSMQEPKPTKEDRTFSVKLITYEPTIHKICKIFLI